MEQNVTRKQKYWVMYMYPTNGGSYCVNDKEITPEEFDTQIPKEAIGYEVSYGSETVRYKSYSVYEGKVLSFKEAKENFSDRRFSPEITQEMIQNGKTTEALQEQFSGNIDLQDKFDKFVQECKQMELSKNFFDNIDSPLVLEQGVVVIATINYPKYIYLRDVVVPSKN